MTVQPGISWRPAKMSLIDGERLTWQIGRSGATLTYVREAPLGGASRHFVLSLGHTVTG